MTARPGSVVDTIDQDHAFAMRLIKERDELRAECDLLKTVLSCLLAIVKHILDGDISPEMKASLEELIKLAREVLLP